MGFQSYVNHINHMLQHSKMYSFCYLFIWLSEIVAIFFVKVILMLKPCWWFVVFLFEAINSYDLWSISYCQVHDGGLCNLFQEHPFQAFGQSHLWLWQTLSSGSCCLGWDSWAMIFVWVVVLFFFVFTAIWGIDPFWRIDIFQMGWNQQLVCVLNMKMHYDWARAFFPHQKQQKGAESCEWVVDTRATTKGTSEK